MGRDVFPQSDAPVEWQSPHKPDHASPNQAHAWRKQRAQGATIPYYKRGYLREQGPGFASFEEATGLGIVSKPLRASSGRTALDARGSYRRLPAWRLLMSSRACDPP